MVLLLIINTLKGSLADELDQFFQAINGWDVAKRFVTPSAFSQARRKLSHQAFIKLLDVICALVNDHGSLATYKGLRVFAIDGSTIRLPNSPLVREHFGSTRTPMGRLAMGRVSLLFDVLNRCTIDAILGNYHIGEISMVWDHLAQACLPKNHLILLDRGYFDFATLRDIVDDGGHFCIRLRSNLSVYRTFMKSGLQDMTLSLHPSKKNQKGFSLDSNFRKPFVVRIVRFEAGKSSYILMTSLLDGGYTISELGDLYHARWQIEESFKVKKCRLQIEQISGTTPEIILQDFHARVLKEALTTAMVLDCQERIEIVNRRRKLDYKVCLTQALAKMKNTLPLLFLRPNPIPLVRDLMDIFTASLVAIEPGRMYPRNLPSGGTKSQSYSFGYRSNR